jgi:hypothetical protein
MVRAFRHIVHAGRNSFAGLRHLLATETAARIELVAAALGFLWLLILGRGIGDFVILAVLFCMPRHQGPRLDGRVLRALRRGAVPARGHGGFGRAGRAVTVRGQGPRHAL